MVFPKSYLLSARETIIISPFQYNIKTKRMGVEMLNVTTVVSQLFQKTFAICISILK